ncbi:MAG TPA: hypothetical protein VEV81_12525 [Pyrinomonadaceae bacterium]|nr:hypothetical protein [Pyrinomonadaceae bacterium]
MLALLLLLQPALVQAQTTQAKDAPAAKAPSTKKAANSEANALAEQRRITALGLLTALADEAKGYRDQALRGRVLARAADALWESENERARLLFQSAWAAAEEADMESARRMEEDIRRQQQTTGSAAVSTPPNIRNEVLRLASRRDRALGEEFLKKIEESREREMANNSLNRDPWMSKPSQAQRLRLATQLLQDGDVDRALQYADPALTSVTADSINFLSALREKSAAEADKRYAMMLQMAAADPSADANTVSGLSSYAFTPFLYIVFSKDGGASQMARRGPTPPPDLPAPLRAAFFSTAAQILLRPSPPVDQDTSSAGRMGKFMILKRLIPLFEKYRPDRVAELRTQMAALSPDVPERERTGENRAVTRGIVPEDASRDPMQAMQERLDRAKDSDERDSIYADMAASLAGSNDERARQLVEKIEETELRRQTLAYVDFQFLNNALQKKDAAEAIRLARGGELTHIQRVWGLTQAARLLMKSERARATELLEEAGAEARRIDASGVERPRAFVAITAGFLEADPTRAWEMISEAVKAANSAEGFTGDDSRMTSMLRFKNGVLMNASNAPDFDLLGIFRSLAKADLYRAIETAKSFTGEAARATATLAIARAVLEEKQK